MVCKIFFAAVSVGLGVPQSARAQRNPDLRAATRYRDQSSGKRHCSTCVNFLPGGPNPGLGRCKVIERDDEIDPNGVCGLWSDT